MSQRKIIQIAFEVIGDNLEEGGSVCSELHALCDDGTIWYYRNKWKRLEIEPIPQDEIANNPANTEAK